MGTEPSDAGRDRLCVTLLPAGQGDSILIEYGDAQAPRRILVDGGPVRSYRAIARQLSRIGRLDLLVTTHVDADHVEGVIELVNDAGLAVPVAEAWFNGYRQLPPDDLLGPAQGEILTALLEKRGIPQNAAFSSAAVQRRPGMALPRVEMAGGLVLTIVAPDAGTLRKLRVVWEKECRAAGLEAGSARDALELLAASKRLRPEDSYLGELDVDALAAQPETEEDLSPANASSIVLLAEYAGRSVLLAGDSTPAVLTAGLERLLAERNLSVLDVDAFKLPHHGSRYNVTRGVLRLVRSPLYLVSTDGKYFGHPDPAAIARVITHGSPGARIVFNYRTDITGVWSEPSLMERYSYRAEYPADPAAGARIEI